MIIRFQFYGTVKAGYDYLANENIVGYVQAFTDLSSDEYFALYVKGDSMNPNICEGDIAIVHKQNDFESNEIVVALVNGDEATIKKAKKIDNEIMLIPINTNYDPVISDKIKIIGVVKSITRNF